MNRWYSAFPLAACIACTDGNGPIGPIDPPPESVPIVEQSIGFGDSPLSGILNFSPAPDGTGDWRYTIMVDGSETPAKGGLVAPGPVFTFRFEEPGVHELVVQLERGDQRTAVSKRVIVNDPGAVLIANTRTVTSGPFTDLEGVAYASSVEDHVFVTQPDPNNILRLDPVSLVVEKEIRVPDSLGESRGLAVSADSTRLYVATDIRRLAILSIPELELLESLKPSGVQVVADTQVETMAREQVVMGGQDGVLVFDVESGQVLRERVIPKAKQFAVSPDHSMTAAIQYLEDRTAVWLLDASTMGDLAVVTLPLLVRNDGAVVSIKADNSRVYVVATVGDPQQWRLHYYAIDTNSFEIVIDQPLGPCEGCLDNLSNPVAVSKDGRYVLVPGLDSSYVIDTAVDLPLYRTSGGGWSAASGNDHAFFLTTFTGTVTKVVVQP